VGSQSDWPCNSNSVCFGSCRLPSPGGAIDGVRAISRNPGRRARPFSVLRSLPSRRVLEDVAVAPARADVHAEHHHNRAGKMPHEKAEEPPQAHSFSDRRRRLGAASFVTEGSGAGHRLRLRHAGP